MHAGSRVRRALGANGAAKRVGVVMVVGGMPGLRGRLMEVAVQGGAGVRVSGEGQLGVGGAESAAQRCADGRLVGTVPERGREASLVHGE